MEYSKKILNLSPPTYQSIPQEGIESVHPEGQNDDAYDISEASGFSERLWTLVKCSFPVVSAYILSVSGNCIILYFAGYVSRKNSDSSLFAGVSLAMTFANVTLMSILDGLSSAVETLSAQHNGARNYRNVGLILNRSVIVLTLLSTFILLCWYISGSFFRHIGVENNIVEVSTRFLALRALSVPADIINLSYEKYLLSMGLMQPTLYACLTYNLILCILEYLFVHTWEWGLNGIIYAFILSSYIESIVLVLASFQHPFVQRTIHFPTTESFSGLGEFLAFGFPGCVMLCAEWWAYEILIMFASVLGGDAVTVQTIVLQVLIISFMFPLGIGIAASSLVGNALGAGKVQLASELARLSLGFVFTLSMVIAPVILFVGPYFMELFTADKKVKELCNQLLFLLAYSASMDCMQGVSSGILRGAGKQNIGAFTNLVAFYIIGVPGAWLLCFHFNHGVAGLMYGIVMGSTMQALVLLYFILCKASYVFTEIEDIRAGRSRKPSSPLINPHGAAIMNHILLSGV